ncbi:Golgi transport complex subunit 4 [Homalodisca vitripennis]|nr:Golgi transport complex subunit 4 [Homalodisca vitripennis]KAG8291530.1 Golgi transport complex subunit 4 [Homalodisca vitripennis]
MATAETQDLSTPEDIKKAYDDLTKEEEDCKKELDLLLSRHCQLDAKVRGITKVLPNLQVVHSDSLQLAEMLTFISTLAENVSAKVRQLDNARSRVSECQQRVHDLLDLQLCSDGVTAALASDDYEKAAAHVHRFLTMDQSQLEQTADDMQQDCATVSNSLSLLRTAAGQLQNIITLRFNEAVTADDLASVERFFKLFPLLNMHDYGLEKFSAFLCSKLKVTALKNLQNAQKTTTSDKRANVIYADTLTLLFEEIARVVEIHQPLVETYYGFGKLHKVVSLLQQECDRQSRLVLTEFGKQRLLERRVALIHELERSTAQPATTATGIVDPREVDQLLGEITIMHSRYHLYLRFIRRRVTNDLEVGVTDMAARTEHQDKLEKMIQDSELCRRMQELLSIYLQLERFYMFQSVNKAVAMDSVEAGSNVSSMVDDIFFIVRKCIRRAASTGNLDGVCAVINNACAALETEVCPALKQQLRLGYPSGYLDLTQAYNVMIQGRLQPSDSEQARNTFLVYLNNADVSCEYVTTLCRGLCQEIPVNSQQERAKLDSCLAGLGTVTASMGAIVDYGLQQLRVSAIKPRVAPWVDTFLSLSHHLTEEEFSSYEANEPFIRNLIANLDSLLSEFKKTLTPANCDALVGILVSEVTSQMEKVISKSEFNRNCSRRGSID